MIENKKIFNKDNIVAYSVKVIAYAFLVSGSLILFFYINSLNILLKEKIFFAFYGVIALIISFVFVYAIGELLQILHDIRKKIYEKL